MENWSKFVESQLVGVHFLENKKRIELSFSLSSGQQHKIVLRGVDRFLMGEMREKNIVESIQLYDHCDTEGKFESAVSALVTGCEDKNECDESFLPVIQNILRAVEAGSQIFVVVRAIYGAQILALARAIDVVN